MTSDTPSAETPASRPGSSASDRALASYLAPMIVFGVVTALEGYVPGSLYPVVYAVKIAAVAACFAVWPAALADLRAGGAAVLPAVLVGLAVFALWIGLEEYLPYPHMGTRLGFDPGTIQSDAGRVAFLAVRLTGLVVVVPLMEELFWRSLALRYLTHPDFLTVPIGRFSATAFVLMVAGFSLTHSEWLSAALTGVLYGGLVWQTRSVLAAVIAHAVTNGALGVYVLMTGKWFYW